MVYELLVIFGVLLIIVYVMLGFRIVRASHAGLVHTFGNVTSVKKPGLRWIMPFFQRLHSIEDKKKTIEIEGDEVFTSDKIALTIGVNLIYEISDYKKYMGLENQELAVTNISKGTLKEIFSSHTLQYFVSNMKKVTGEIKTQANQYLADMGIRIIDVKVSKMSLSHDMRKLISKKDLKEKLDKIAKSKKICF